MNWSRCLLSLRSILVSSSLVASQANVFCVILSGVCGVEGPRCPHRERGSISRHINDASLLFVDGKRFYAMEIKIIRAGDTDLETLALSQNKRFWHVFDAPMNVPKKKVG
jgi:hypothetical protein